MEENRGLEELIIVPADGDHVKCFVNMWVPYHLMARATDPNDRYRLFPWDQIVGHGSVAAYAAVDPANDVEGFIALPATADMSLSGLRILFVSAAPWNHGHRRERRGVGAGLIGFAALESKRLSLQGALLLNSTPESEPFYERLRFMRTGRRDIENLAEFYLPANEADQLLKSYPPIRMQ